MAYQKRSRIEAHDAAGYETDYINFSDHGDGYGNVVLHGDLSVQRMVEEGTRDTRASDYDDDPRAVAYDKEPWQSPAQRRYMFAAEARGDVPAGTARRYGRHK